MKNPKRILRCLILSVFVALGIALATPAHASHIVGAEITYKFLGNDNYLIYVDLYRDYCGANENTLDTIAYIDIFNDSGAQWPDIDPNSKNLPLITADTIPNNIAGDPCLFIPSGVCIQRLHYEGIVQVIGPGGFHVVYQRCCRNEDIINIPFPRNTGSTSWIYVSALARSLGNSSPQFGFYPPVFVCVNKNIQHPHAATDIDGDSMVYKLFTPFTASDSTKPQPVPFPDPDPLGSHGIIMPPPFTPVTWIDPPFNQNQMLGPSSIPLNIDHFTGLISGLPNIQGRFVVGVLVEEYRDGRLLSIVRRDFQYEVGECAELNVQIVAPDAQCDDLSVLFQNLTGVAQNFIWYFDWPNATPSSTQKEPNFTYPGTGTYVVALVAEPIGACVDTAFHEIFLQQNSLTADFSWQTFDCTNQSALVLTDLSVDTVSPIISWHWEVNYGATTVFSSIQNPIFSIPNPSSGTIKLTVVSENGCEQTKIVDFVSGGNNPIDDLDTVSVCLGQPAFLNPNGSTGFTYQWGANVPSNQQNLPNPSVLTLIDMSYSVTITAPNNICQVSGLVFVDVLQPVQLAFSPDTDCDATIVHFVNQSQNAPTGVVWNFGDTTTISDVSTEYNPTWDYPAFGSYTVTLMTPPNAVCKDTIQQSILLEQKTLEADFSFGYTGCEEGVVSVQFFDETNNSEDDTNSWLWTFSGVYTGTSTLMNPSIMVSQTGWLYVTLKAMTSENCSDTTALDSLYIDLTELPNLEDDGEVLGCLNGGATLNPGGDTTYTYSWSPSNGLSCTNCPSPNANPSTTSTYTVTVTNLNGADTCIITRMITVVVPSDIHLVGSSDVTTCDPTTTLSATVGMLPVDYAWFDENGTQIAGDVQTVTVPVAGYSYFVVRATDPEGCHYYDTINVVGGPPNIEAIGAQVICSDELLSVSATNLDQNDTLTWQWTPDPIFNGPTNVQNPSVQILTGDRWLYVTATNQFGCSATDSTYVAVVDTANTLDFEYVVSCNGSDVQFVNTSMNAFNYTWNFGDPTSVSDTSHLDNPVYNYPGPGTYLVQLTMDFDLACVDTLEKQVVILSTQFVPDFTYDYVYCETDSIVVQFHDATTIQQPGIFVDSIFWETSEGDTSSLPSPTFTIYDGETFLVTMTVFFTNDCSGTKTEELKLEFIDENLPDTIVLCKGDSVQINPDGDTGYHYNWTPNDFISDPTAANPTVWPNSTTVYTVEITDFSPDTCSITREVTIFVPTEIQVTAQNDTISCGLPIELCASTNLQNAQYQWAIIPDGLIGTGNCLNVLVQSDTYYEVTATDQYGCQDRDTVFVADESVKLNWQNLGAECPEIEVPLTVNNLVPDHINTYAWSVVGNGQVLPPATGPNVTIITPAAGQAGNYTVVATNQFGCSANLTQSIAGQNFIPTVQDSIDVCPGVITPLNPGADPTLNYVWSPNIGLSCTNCPNPNATISQSMVYTVAVSGTFGLDHCEETIAVDVFSAPIINITETVDTFTCGDTILIAAQANVPLSSIQWTDASGNVLVTNIYSLNVAPVDEETYTIFVTDMFNCTATDTILVANHQLDLELTGGGVIDTCPMPSYNICVNNLDPEDLLDFVWTASNGGSILSGDTTGCPEVTTQQGLTALFEVVVTNQWGCSTTESFDITTYTFDPILRQSVIVCPNVATPINPSAENSTLTYIWSPSTWLSCNDCPNPSVNMPSGLQQFYEVTILGFNGADTCSLIQTVQVQSLPEHGLFTTPTDSVLCESTDVLLSAFYSSNFITGLAWSQTLDFSNPFSTADTVTVTPTETELYYVQTTDTLGCRDTALITINAYPVDISVDSLFNYCEEIGSLTIPVTNHYPSLPLTFVWTPLEHIALQNPDGSIVISGLEMDEVYIVDATNEYGCHEMDTADVFYYDIESTLADTIAYSKKTIFYGSGEFSQLEIDCWPGYTYEWTPTTGLNDPTICNPQAMPEDTTTYTLLITDQGGCQATRQVTVCVLNPDCDEPNLFLPNAFTPNDNDGNAMNDVLYFRSNIVSEMELAIYNRWGQRVFFSDDQSIGWDGTLNGQPLSPDVYGFYLRAKCFNGQEYFKKGNITLLR